MSNVFETLPYQSKHVLETSAIQTLYRHEVLHPLEREALLWRLRMVNPGTFDHLDRGETFHAIPDDSGLIERRWE